MGLSKRSGRYAAVILTGIVGAIIAIGLFGRPSYHIGAMDVRFSVLPALSGETRILVPPLGRITARTHSGPMTLQASIEEASVEELRAILIRRPERGALMERLITDTRSAIINFGVRMLVLALAGGIAATLLIASRSLRLIALGGISGLILAAVPIAIALGTYDTGAFRQPVMTNALKATPWLVPLLQEGIVKIEEVDTQVRSAAVNIYKLESTMSAMASTGDEGEQIRVLAISDLHNNTIGMAFADNLANLFDVDIIINAGDLTDFGSEFESDVAKGVASFDRPHVFVTGNHDSVETLVALRRIRNTHIVNERVVQVAGLRILGQHDPASKEQPPRDLTATPEQLSRATRDLQAVLERMPRPPDILLVHEPVIADKFLGKVPVVISGHDHILAVEQVQGTVWVRPGTTGASGVRYLTGNSGKAMTAALIHMTRPPNPRVVAVDLISLSGLAGEFTVSRKRFQSGD